MLPGLGGMLAGLGRQPVELVASSIDTTDRSGSYTFAGLNFGEDFTGRTLVAVVTLFATGNVILDQTSVTIGGSAAAGNDNGDAGGGAPNGTAGVGIWAAKPSGTSGSIVVNFTSGTAGTCAVWVFAVTDVASTTTSSTLQISSASGYTSGASGTLNIPANGTQFTVVVRANNTGAITLSGATERIQTTIETVHRVAIGYDYRMAAETGRTVGFTTGSANVVFALRVATYV
ncbi:hypothetical protein ACHMW7_16245 [Aminobacter sp. UC22_36]|uniref:hypothetical protein n=1 Tax=Aminobacter sp. UC22_36 TaxID=3374549 RepID=UPI0037582F11